MTKHQGKAIVEIQEDLPREIKDIIIDNEEAVARMMVADLKTKDRYFIDDTGALRSTIRAVKSKYDEGGWLVKAGGSKAPHAHLVEWGYQRGSVKMGAKGYLKKAKERAIPEAVMLFGAK